MSTKIGRACDSLLDRLGRRLAGKLNSQSSGYRPFTPSDFPSLCRTLKPGDVLLIEGRQRISNAIKYLTQSTWSHAAMYVGDALPDPDDGSERPRLVEVNISDGCVAVGLSKYATYNTRICRPIGLNDAECAAVITFMIEHLGLRYDMRNIVDLLRYFLPTPPVPVRWRRRMIAFGSGDPTRAICSSLLAQAFQSVHYPILPERQPAAPDGLGIHEHDEILHIRNYALFTPRDFDLSPWFGVIKPEMPGGLSRRTIAPRAQKPEHKSLSTEA